MSLQAIRLNIDVLDEQIVALLEQRFQLVLQMKQFKLSLTDVAREQAILSQITSIYIQNIYKEVFRNSKQLLLDEGFSESNL